MNPTCISENIRGFGVTFWVEDITWDWVDTAVSWVSQVTRMVS